jgi:L-threonylcarbamoyladenylate synthase
VNQMDIAIETLRAGRPIVVPTDTVYGIGVLPAVPGSIDEIYRIKGRPAHKPIPVLGPSRSTLEEVVVFSDAASALADRFWPGPLTIVLPRQFTFAADLGGTGKQEDVAVRIPEHDVCLELLRRAGPLAVTSANPSGREPARSVDEARSYFGDAVDVFIEGGRCDGAPSTVVRLVDGLEILREGAVTRAALERALPG